MGQYVIGREAEHHPPLPDEPILAPAVPSEHLGLTVEFAAVDLDHDPRSFVHEITHVRTDRQVGRECESANAELAAEYALGFRRRAEGSVPQEPSRRGHPVPTAVGEAEVTELVGIDASIQLGIDE